MATQRKIPKKAEISKDEIIINSKSSPSQPAQGAIPKTSDLSTEIKIPTKGVFYENGMDTFTLRPMTVKEEKIMTTTRLVRTGEALNKILQNCVEYPKVPIKSLKLADTSYLMVALRQLSYGNDYGFVVQCPNCGSQYNDDINLSELPVNFIPDEAVDCDFTVELPQSGTTIKIRLLDGYDEEKISSKKKARAKYSNAKDMYDETYVDRLMLSVEEVNGDILGEKELHDFIESLTVIDSEALRDKIDEYSAGIDTEIETDCPICGSYAIITMPLDVNFFRHSRKRNKSRRKK